MSTYFKNFPITPYSFGNNLVNVGFPNISAYVEVIDVVKDTIAFYRKFYIQEGDRPDQVSMQLYDTPDYYYTFFMMNDNIREQGWPLSEQQLKERATTDFPHQVLTTNAILTGIFKVGAMISGSTSGATGKIIGRNLDLGQIIIDRATIVGTFRKTEIITSQVGDSIQSVTLTNSIDQVNAIKHYVNGDKQLSDINPHSGVISSELTPITNLEYYREQNDGLKEIKVIKPGSITQIAKAFREEFR